MRLLLIHQNLPGQYRHILMHYARDPSCQVVGMGDAKHVKQNFGKALPGAHLVGYETPPEVNPHTPPTLHTTEAAVTRGQYVLAALLKLKRQGFYPDVVYAHPGWGETLFLKEAFPRARLMHFCEFYYNVEGQDFNFDPEFRSDPLDVLRLRTRNLHHLMALEQADLGVAPTHWQRSRFPAHYGHKIEVVHDGVDTDAVRPDPDAFLLFPEKNVRLTRADQVITFVSRNLEPYRGFHIFMRALPELMERYPKAHVVIVGGDGVSYGKLLSGDSYRSRALREVGGSLDFDRLHFVGKLPYKTYLNVLQVSSAHIYLTYPFVLSWSMMEAMSAGCLVIGSKTAPVEEVIEDGVNGFLVDFFSKKELLDALSRVLDAPDAVEGLRRNARETIK